MDRLGIGLFDDIDSGVFAAEFIAGKMVDSLYLAVPTEYGHEGLAERRNRGVAMPMALPRLADGRRVP